MHGTELVGVCRCLVIAVLRAAGTRKHQRHPITFKPGEISFTSLHSIVRFQEAHSLEKQPGEQRPLGLVGSGGTLCTQQHPVGS